ncbi:hypothetical protein BDA96_08G128400 [Sorghum bicolor]|uniref:DNA-directed RNA polymerase subunit n=2 Tax=Sorghum bicolor TaxID=4558 RepID=A0A921QFL5_SORBI|nr:uncharacterized protein LOC8064632 [Sorghum bicolor]EES17120.1 hypothetical protein SORBI_3008G115600 [Sorghum bicolor]KAG0521059.1 hypothetical protein BDA96_08G128400 [Sorghum bicolor]|eukprot:XP_002443282.1 uncharacterized protein LOC8064632 [Sorghum bicolor]
MEALRIAEAELTVYVHPSNAKRVRHAVNRQLSSLLFTYDDRFNGVVLMHEVAFHLGQGNEGEPNKDESGGPKDESGEPKSCAKGKIKDGRGEPKSCVKGKTKDKSSEPKDESGKPKICIKGKIMNGLVPYFGVQVQAQLLLFSPQPDMILEGKVEMLGKESIHAIVLGLFSVAIMSEDIHEKFRFKRKSDRGKYVSRTDKHHVIKRGTMIRFSVKRVDTEMNCHITGSLIPPHTGCMRWLSVHDTEYASELKSGESRPRDTSIKFEQNEQEHRILKNEDGMVKSERPHKSRKRRHTEE